MFNSRPSGNAFASYDGGMEFKSGIIRTIRIQIRDYPVQIRDYPDCKAEKAEPH